MRPFLFVSLLLLTCALFGLNIAEAQGVNEIVVPENFSIVPQGCGATLKEECNVCDFAALIANIFQALIYGATVGCSMLFMWAGFKYITAADNPGQIKEAHQIIWNVIIGFVFLLGSWVVVDTIMKAFLVRDGQVHINGQLGSKWGPWNEIICPPGFVPEVGEIETEGGVTIRPNSGTGTGGGSLSGNSPISGTAGCPDCVDLTQNGFTCRIGSGGPCVASPAILTELKALKSGTSEAWVITAGYQKGMHAATCQSTYGTCVDAAFTDKNYSDVNRIVSFQKAASDAGCPSQFESNSGSLVNAVNNAGGNALLINYPPHFSLYCNK